jgi:hypothetical protein
MIKTLIIIFIALVGVYLFMWGAGIYDRTARNPGQGEVSEAPAAAVVAVPADQLPGLPPALEASLRTAQEQGVEELGKWLKQFGRQVQDPRLAAIELDYVVLLNLKNHKAARERFIAVASRIQPGSPIFERVRKLAPAYDDP